MSVVQNIMLLKIANKLTYEELLNFKAAGRPKPTMPIKQTTLDKTREVNRYFSASMYNVSEWICGCEVQKAFFCFPCLLFGDDYSWTKAGVVDLKHLKEKSQKHSLLSAHINSCCSLAMLGSVVIKLLSDNEYNQGFKTYNENVSKNRFVLNKMIDCILFCGAFELDRRDKQNRREPSDSQTIFGGLIDFVSEVDIIFKENFKNSAIFKDSSNDIKNGLLDSILAVIQGEIRSEILQADFVAIQADTITDNNKVAIILRYVKDDVVCERFYTLIQSKGIDIEYLSAVILQELQQMKLNEHPEKLVGQSYDAASVRSGGMGGVQAKIKSFCYTSAHFIHSYAHPLNLILQKAASQDRAVKVFFANLESFSSFFGKSPERTAVLDEIVKIGLIKEVPTYWDFNTKVIETVYTNKSELIDCIDKIIDSETNNSSINQAMSLKNYLEDENFLYWLNFFHAVMPHCDVLFDVLQKRDLDIVTIDKCIMNFRNKIQAIKCNIMTNCEVCELENSLKRRKIEDSKRRISLEVCNIIICEIEHRFGRSNYLILSQLFYSDKFICYRQDFPENIFKLVKTEYPVINHSKLKTELEVVYSREDFNNYEGATSFLQFFINHNSWGAFSESVKLLKILCAIPMKTDETGRCFLTSQRIKTFFGKTMSQERMCAWAMLSIEKNFVKNIKDFNEKVIDHLASQNTSGIDLVYKTH
ncbi:uncharacterized protein LOC114333658 [Diabrotica virgifera virgifera]|uniref:Zinc finger MYM-type protein 1-like n=1 Tax=Diabrotica virgifera virgifera TaxID=50390 RepID=A0ABM5JRJ1_DIAVI|nr:uncharacterized protein LOC114333658 [Diabrotica virgifera virgifera]